MSKEMGNLDPDPIVFALEDPICAERSSQDSKERAEQKGRDLSKSNDYTVYKEYGQHFVPTREIWVQYFERYGEDSGESQSRNGFVKTVFAIVLLLLLLTAGFNLIVHLTPELLDFFQSKKGSFVAIGCSVGLMVVSLAVCFLDCVYYPPGNYIVLIASLIFMSGITAFCTAITQTTLVLFALAATCCVVFVIILIACSSWDFTKWWNYIMVAALSVGIVSIIIYAGMAIMDTQFKPLSIALTVIGTLVQSVVLIVVLQSILGGKTVVMSEELYVIAAYEVYTSIISIFLHILRLLNFLED